MAVQTQIQWRRGTAASWTSTNPTLAAGEVGLETDTGKFKVGTGSSTWTALAYGTVLPATLTAKGSILAASAASTPAELAVGTDGTYLQADSSTSTGLRYVTPDSLANPFINSAFDIWQRGTSFTAGTYIFTADRWTFQRQSGTAGGTISRQTTSDTTNLPNIQYCARVQRNSGDTSTSFLQLINSMESVDCIPFAGKNVTFSFYARAGSNYSATSSLLGATLETGTGTDQNRAAVGYTGSNTSITSNVVLTTTWQRFTITGTIPTTATEFCAFFRFTPTGTAGANDYFEITGISVNLGASTAATLPTFSRNSETIQGELAACQRYYWRHTSAGNYDTYTPIVTASATNQAYAAIPVPVQMRVAPTSVDSGGTNYISLYAGGTNYATTSITLAGSSNNAYLPTIILGLGTSPLTTGNKYDFISNGSTSSYIGFSAEL